MDGFSGTERIIKLMKNLIIINGTMGAGKTITSKELQKILPHNVFLDGDWCWNMEPFTVTDETKAMVVDNITYLLNNFIRCSVYENIIFCWVMHEQDIIDQVISGLNTSDCRVKVFSLVLNEKALRERMGRDVMAGIRSEDAIQRSIDRIDLYQKLNTVKIDVSNISASQAAELIKSKLAFEK